MIVAVINQKGGVGKTTSSTNIAAALSTTGKRILLVDLDAQSNATNGVGIDDETLELSINNLLSSKVPKKERILEVIQKTSYENLDLLPADMTLSDAEITLSGCYSRETILSKVLNQLREDYDYIIIDCPPSLGLLSVNALVASDSLIIPVQANYFSVKGIKRLVNTINLVRESLNPNLDIMGVLITMFDTRKSLNKNIKKQLENSFGDKIFKTIIRTNTQIEKSQENLKPVIFYDEQCNGYIDYMNLAQEVLNYER